MISETQVNMKQSLINMVLRTNITALQEEQIYRLNCVQRKQCICIEMKTKPLKLWKSTKAEEKSGLYRPIGQIKKIVLIYLWRISQDRLVNINCKYPGLSSIMLN